MNRLIIAIMGLWLGGHQDHAIETTPSLHPAAWTAVLNTNMSVTPFVWTDPDAVHHPQRFYRLRYGP